MHDQLVTPSAEQIEATATSTAERLCKNSVRPVYNPAAIREAIRISLCFNLPLRLRMVLCPNWAVVDGNRTVKPIPVEVNDNHLEVADPNLKIIGLLAEEVPSLVHYLNRQGLRVELLVILADILSSGWVHDPKRAKEMLTQNQKAIGLLLFSRGGKEVFNEPERARVKIQSQLQLATNTPGYEEALMTYQRTALTCDSPMFQWYIKVIRQLQEMGEYADKRSDVAGMRKIWERALFLASIYALDGQMIRRDFVTANFPSYEREPGHIALGTVNTRHGDIIAEGWNLLLEAPVGVITPFNNAMEHGWAEPRNPAVNYQENPR